MNTIDLPRGAGTAIFPGGGAWLPRAAGHPPAGSRSDPAVLLSTRPASWSPRGPTSYAALLDEIEAEQLRGRYVAGYLAYEAGAAFGLTVRRTPRAAAAPGALACDSVPLAWMAVYPPESATLVPGRGVGRLPRRLRCRPRGRAAWRPSSPS